MNHGTALLILTAAGIMASAHARVIVVNTADNADFSPGKTNLWLAITMANTNKEAANAINFNIPGAGPHYLITPPLYAPLNVPALGGGYPIITNHNLTIDGYSQPGARPNTNTILGSNTAVLKIIIDSRAANYSWEENHPFQIGAETMDYSLITRKTYGNATTGYAGYGPTDAAQLGIFQATNVTIKGLCFLNDWYPGFNNLNVASIALAADYPTNLAVSATHYYPDHKLHVAGCWFNLLPDGVTVVDGGYNAVRVQRHRQISGNAYTGGRWSPSGVTVGVAKDSTNPRAEFNIIMSQSAGTSIQGERNRWCGNFFNVFADGMHQYFPDPSRYPSTVDQAYVPTSSFIGGNYGGYGVIGTDGDGVNDAEERNIFAGMPRKRSNGQAQIDHQCGCYNVKVAGNYFGVAVDGVTRWTNSCTPFRFSNRPDTPTNCVFGTEFDGASDDLEANVICNNWPFDYWFEYPEYEPDLTTYFGVLAPLYQRGAPPETLNTDATIGQFCHSFRGNKLVNNFTAPMSPFASSRDRQSQDWYFASYTNIIQSWPGTPSANSGLGDGYEGATNFIAVLDPSSSTRRLKGTFQLGRAPYTNVVIDVYVANEEGLINGAKFQTLTNILPVWAQGERVLAYNLQADKTGDLDPATGAFNFSISQYSIPVGTKVTVTASYAKAGKVGTYMAEMHTSRFSLPVALNAAPPITITSIVNNRNGTGTIHWTGGHAPYIVEQCTNLATGVWVPIATTTAPTITGPLSQTAAFYRVQ